ncbi:hypothetical protein MC7420_114 [Coleofasciculus chthonoplastes PCC 7420]|uniref:Uncharacterized protein n=1 Tax=Coleofasciculus chthonoplastes PCC 7420 TaxID=118168 RepID=B4W4R0_9CYAN|nr:hypothetical protein MC7420_114 [Coleofasciculus chthonoplastes PCC 7420]
MCQYRSHSYHLLNISPSSPNPSPTVGRRGTRFSYSPLAPLSQAWERGWG